MAQLKRYNGTSWETIGGTVTGDTLPIGSEVDYDGTSVPAGWEEIDDPNTYSTSETKIGTWIDGKPIYRKVITGEYALSAGENYIPHNISNLKECINAIAFDASATRLPSLGNASSLTYGSNIRAVNSTHIQIRSINDTWASRVWYFILEYTKTTD